jgi:hypothetical protein
MRRYGASNCMISMVCPEGVELAPGSITVRFREPDEALQKLMALALAIGQNRPAFEERVTVPKD